MRVSKPCRECERSICGLKIMLNIYTKRINYTICCDTHVLAPVPRFSDSAGTLAEIDSEKCPRSAGVQACSPLAMMGDKFMCSTSAVAGHHHKTKIYASDKAKNLVCVLQSSDMHAAAESYIRDHEHTGNSYGCVYALGSQTSGFAVCPLYRYIHMVWRLACMVASPQIFIRVKSALKHQSISRIVAKCLRPAFLGTKMKNFN
jgi:hypothetical protein